MSNMVNLPVAWVVSALAIIAAVALLMNGRMPAAVRAFFCVFLMSLATIGMLLGLRLSFAMTWPAQLQPLIALMVGPSAYLGFLTLTQDHDQSWKRPLAVNAVFIVLAQLAILGPVPVSADVFVLGFNIVYLVRIAAFLSREPDEFVHVAA